MKNASIYREVFIRNTIHLVANGGFEKATTRAIAGDRREVSNVKLNEAHIYRLFGTKEKLLEETFSELDEELIRAVTDNFHIFNTDEPFREQCWEFYCGLWKFLMQNEEKCRYYTQYYFSAYFRTGGSEEHLKRFEIFINRLSFRFVDNADVYAIMHHVISTLLNFATMVYNGDLENNEENTYHIFNVAYCSIASYIK
ncbi:MAG: TetR/AcrR family transcriptional regulator [Clostridia bacterium]|nr:TetR/AcrR family transcriptional regulator [Clostridia bacterium]